MLTVPKLPAMPYQTTQIAIWCGFQDKNGLKAAPVLDFVLSALASGTSLNPQSALKQLRERARSASRGAA